MGRITACISAGLAVAIGIFDSSGDCRDLTLFLNDFEDVIHSAFHEWDRERKMNLFHLVHVRKESNYRYGKMLKYVLPVVAILTLYVVL